MSIYKYVPEILSNEEDYKVFVSIIDQVNSDIKSIIEVYPELVDVDSCETLFMPKLTELLNFKLNCNIDNSVKREIIKRIIDIYRNRGTEDSIVTAATYGDNDLWVGDHVFLPGNLVKDLNAELSYPTTLLFKHDISRFSGSHKYPDGVKWRSGVIIIRVARLNDRIKNAILNVIPAGLKAYIEIDFNVGKAVDLVSFESWFVLNLWYDLDYNLSLDDRISGLKYDISIHSGSLPLSGRRKVSYDYEVDYLLDEIFYKLSIVPSDAIYPVSIVGNLNIWEMRDDSAVWIDQQFINNSLVESYDDKFYQVALNK